MSKKGKQLKPKEKPQIKEEEEKNVTDAAPQLEQTISTGRDRNVWEKSIMSKKGKQLKSKAKTQIKEEEKNVIGAAPQLEQAISTGRDRNVSPEEPRPGPSTEYNQPEEPRKLRVRKPTKEKQPNFVLVAKTKKRPKPYKKITKPTGKTSVSKKQRFAQLPNSPLDPDEVIDYILKGNPRRRRGAGSKQGRLKPTAGPRPLASPAPFH